MIEFRIAPTLTSTTENLLKMFSVRFRDGIKTIQRCAMLSKNCKKMALVDATLSRE